MENVQSIKEASLAYEGGKKTLNVADLPVFDVNMPLQVFDGVDMNGRKFRYFYVEGRDGQRYRVPGIVLAQVKEHLSENPEQCLFKVKRSGEGLKTMYLVVPVAGDARE